ncbi:helix-turn-helix domain-containing protein [Amycolatopsis sp. NPDC004368]
MGNKITRWALRQQAGAAPAKAVLLVLAGYADPTGRCADLPLADIAEASELSRSSVKRALAALDKAKLIEVTETHHDDGRRSINKYQLSIKPPVQSEPGPRVTQTPPPVHSEPGPRVTVNRYGSTVTRPLTSENENGGVTVNRPSSSLPPSEVVVPRAGATRAHTRTHTRDAHARTEEPTPQRQRLDELNDTAVRPDTRRLIAAWRAGHATPVTDKLVRQMTDIVDKAVRSGRDSECLAAALREWNARPDLFSPKMLVNLYDDAVSRKNAGEPLDRPLIDDNGHPRIDPQQIPDEALTRAVVDRVLGPESTQPPIYPPDADHPHGYDDPAEIAARREFFAEWAAARLAERRPLARRALIKAWNREGAA